MRELKKGDRVRCTDIQHATLITLNSNYTILERFNGAGNINYVRLEGIKEHHSYYETQFELIEDTPQRFKKGDKLLCIDDGDNYGIVTGKIYTMSSYYHIDEGELEDEYLIELEENPDNGGYFQGRFILAPEEIKPKQKVKIIYKIPRLVEI